MSDAGTLSGKRVAILVEQEFEDSELSGPRDALIAAGATVVMVGPISGAEYRGKRGEAVVTSELAPVAAICHGPQLLISANALRGRTLTCWPSIAIDVKNAGGLYVDKPVVEDGNLITSRKPDDVRAFSEAIVRAVAGRKPQ